MFSRKNIIMIALIAIFVMGAVVLQATYIVVRNVYSIYSHDALDLVVTDYEGNPVFHFNTGPLYNVPSTYEFNCPVDPGQYNYIVTQGNREASGTFHSSQYEEIVILPGGYEKREGIPGQE